MVANRSHHQIGLRVASLTDELPYLDSPISVSGHYKVSKRKAFTFDLAFHSSIQRGGWKCRMQLSGFWKLLEIAISPLLDEGVLSGIEFSFSWNLIEYWWSSVSHQSSSKADNKRTVVIGSRISATLMYRLLADRMIHFSVRRCHVCFISVAQILRDHSRPSNSTDQILTAMLSFKFKLRLTVYVASLLAFPPGRPVLLELRPLRPVGVRWKRIQVRWLRWRPLALRW